MAKTDYAALFEEALKAGARRDYHTSCELLSRIAAETDAIPQAALYLGRAQHAAGDHALAIATLAQYANRHPQEPDAWFFLGRSFLSAQRPREALRCLQKSRQLGRNTAATLALIGFAELKLKRAARAVSTLEQAHVMEPQDPAIFRAYRNALQIMAIRELHQGKPDSSRQMLDFVIKNGGISTATYLYRAAASRELGRNEDAIADLREAARLSPQDTGIQLQLAVLYLGSGDSQAGFQLLDQLHLRLPGDSQTPWSAEALERWRAMTALQRGEARQALASALTLLRRGDRNPVTRVLCAQANLELGQYYKAIEHFKRAVELDPQSPAIRLALALALWHNGDYAAARHAAMAAAQRGADKADTDYLELLCSAKSASNSSSLLQLAQQQLKLRPGDPRLIAIYAEALYKSGRPELAGNWFETLIRLEPDNDLARLYLISVAESLADDQLAFKRYREYLANFPDNTRIRREYIQKLVDHEHWDTALEVLEAGFPYDPGSRTNNALLAACYRNTKQYRLAAIQYRSLLAAHPKHEGYLLALAWCLERSSATVLATELLARGAAFLKNRTEPWLALGILLARQKRNEEACTAFGKAMELAPADPRPLEQLAALYRASGSSEMAERFAKKAAALQIRR